jgi:crotonobetainyl-CoA:carnitine CoA-transferase CaiB-like acyl-CoA transferase
MEGMLPEYGALGKVKQPTGGGIATAAPTNAYPTADGVWMLIAANSEPLFARLMALVGRTDLVGTPGYAGNQQRVANVVQLDRLIGDWTRTLDADALEALLTEADIPNSRAYTAADIAVDPQYRQRGMVRAVTDPNFVDPVLHNGIVPHMVEGPGEVRWAGPVIGAHTEEILGELLDMDADDIDALRQSGVV